MIFHSLDFLVFFAAVLGLYWRLPLRAQNGLLLGASWLFYGYVHPWFLLLIGFTTTVDYLCARMMVSRPERKRLALAISLTASLGTLATFKYFNFFSENVRAALASFGWELSPVTLGIALPVGISFYTFQSAGFVIDVFRGRIAPARSWGEHALYLAFFPQLVAGPIERSAHLLPQIRNPRRFDPVRARGAVVLILWGFFKKLVVADNVAATANRVFALESPAFPVLWAGVFAFAIQIFADFSAYTDIARGTGRLLGFDLMENFRHPYLARSPQEFWQRWHISLSTWFRDYVYIPLGGSRGGPSRTLRNLLLTFFLSGLWHGASWNYVLWGLYHGVLMVLYRAAGSVVPARLAGARWLQGPRWALMFVLILVGWLLFRETSLPHLAHALTLNPLAASAADWQAGAFLFVSACLFALPVWVHHLAGLGPSDAWEQLGRARPALAYALQCAAAVAFFAGILVLRSAVSSDFIYFQF